MLLAEEEEDMAGGDANTDRRTTLLQAFPLQQTPPDTQIQPATQTTRNSNTANPQQTITQTSDATTTGCDLTSKLLYSSYNTPYIVSTYRTANDEPFVSLTAAVIGGLDSYEVHFRDGWCLEVRTQWPNALFCPAKFADDESPEQRDVRNNYPETTSYRECLRVIRPNDATRVPLTYVFHLPRECEQRVILSRPLEGQQTKLLYIRLREKYDSFRVHVGSFSPQTVLSSSPH